MEEDRGSLEAIVASSQKKQTKKKKIKKPAFAVIYDEVRTQTAMRDN